MADIRTNLRLPEELYAQIKQLAARDLRSVNAQMIALLQEAIAHRQQELQRQEQRPDQELR